MDSLTQFTLGAAIGEAVLGKKIGNKAILWGGLAGTIPDLDVLLNPFVDAITELSLHRGESHAFFYILIAAPIIAWMVWQFYKNRTSYKDWMLLFVLGMITHPMLDALTTYGTQLFLPFSNVRVAHSSIFLVDFFYTLPMLLMLIAAAFYKKESHRRHRLNHIGLFISTAYLCFTLVNKELVTHQFEKALEAQNISYREGRIFTQPTPLNNWMWQATIETDKGYYFGIFNWIDRRPEFIFSPNNHELLNQAEGSQALDRLKWFSNDYYIGQEREGKLFLIDARFGATAGWHTNKPLFVFKFELIKDKTDTWDIVFVRGPDDDLNMIWKEFSTYLVGKRLD